MQMHRLLRILLPFIISFLLYQKGYREYFELVDEIVIKSVGAPIMPHPGYFAIVSDAIIISYPDYGIFMFDTNGVLKKKLLDASGPICIFEKDNSIFCWDVTSRYLVSMKIKEKVVKQWLMPYQYVWQMQGFKDCIYLSLFHLNENSFDKVVPALVKFSPKSNTWSDILRVRLKPGESVTGLFDIASDGIIYFSFEDKIVKVTPEGKVIDFIVLKRQHGYYILSFNIIESEDKIILEKSNRYGHKKIDIIDLKSARVVAHDLEIPYSLVIGVHLDKIYIVVDDTLKVKLNQSCKIGVFKLKKQGNDKN